MEAEMRNVVDDVLDELREDPTLWGIIHFMKVDVKWWFSQDEIPARVAELTVTCDTLI
jgi:hypothetical protein